MRLAGLIALLTGGLMLLTGPLAYLPIAALVAVVVLTGLRLIDLGALRRLGAARRDEFAIAVWAAVAVVVLGVTDGIAHAVVASAIDHLRHAYHPRNSVLLESPAGHWRPVPVRPGARTEEALVIYRFGTDLYHAYALRLAEDVKALTGLGGPLQWLVLDSAGIGDVDFTAGSVLLQVIERLHQRHVRFVVTSMRGPVRRQLDRYGITGVRGPDAYHGTPGDALEG